MKLVKTDAVNTDGDIVYYTITEWKERFGEPGSGNDPNGRINGYFPTEPCFCEPTPESQEQLVGELVDLDERISELKARGASLDTIRPLIWERDGLARIITDNQQSIEEEAA